ncbi:MAG: toxin-antitoxin system HicB family antitoxin [Thermoflexales bacterium]|nr:toxin-antitoxin system HicB family antitoxin [Thermoflexales bacterium]
METVKLTVRLPLSLHRALQAQARRRRQSLNQTLVEELARAIGMAPESDAAFIDRVLREQGLRAEAGPVETYLRDAPALTAAEVRRLLNGVPPLSEVVIAERGEL